MKRLRYFVGILLVISFFLGCLGVANAESMTKSFSASLAVLNPDGTWGSKSFKFASYTVNISIQRDNTGRPIGATFKSYDFNDISPVGINSYGPAPSSFSYECYENSQGINVIRVTASGWSYSGFRCSKCTRTTLNEYIDFRSNVTFQYLNQSISGVYK